MKRSRQFEHLQDLSLKRLQVMIPADCPIVVRRRDSQIGGFIAGPVGEHEGHHHVGRYEVVAAWILGYVAAWRAQR